ncbi:MAG: VTT domain-containing protein [Clostridia bacterium]|nr:VTT domain-containing protein [Clostridia bacterium]
MNNKSKKIFSIIELLVLFVIVVGIPVYIYFGQHELLEKFTSVDDVVKYLNGNIFVSSMVFIGFSIVQIVISVIPGEVFQLAAGFFFGIPYGIFLTVLGAVLGTGITFGIARLLGKNSVENIFGKKKLSALTEFSNSKKAYVIIFLIYLIPGIPKDIVSYAAGISSINFKPFILLSSLGRVPGLIGSVIIGSMMYNSNYTGAIIIGVIAAVLFILGLIFHKKLLAWVDEYYEKLSKRGKDE